MINIPKGTKDVLPGEVYRWHHVENVAREVAEAYAFREIRTPVFEHTELFSRGVGDTTDIVNKEMYTFLDKGNRSVTLRPEGTAGVARAFIGNGLSGGAMPFKAYYLISAFRYERGGGSVRRCGDHFSCRPFSAQSGIEKGAFADQFDRLQKLPRGVQSGVERVFFAASGRNVRGLQRALRKESHAHDRLQEREL